MLVYNTLLLFSMISKRFTFAGIYKWGGLLTFYEICFMCFYVTCAFQQRWTCLLISMFGFSSVDTSQVIKCRTTHMVLRWMCVSGAAGAADRLREAVFLTQQQHPLSGALQYPSAGKQSDQVRILYSKQKKLHTIIKITIGNQWQLQKWLLDSFFCPCLPNAKSNSQSVICGLSSPSGVIITQKGHLPSPWDNSSNDGSVFCRFGLLPLSMSNLHKSKSSSRASSHQLVSVTFGIWCSLLLIYVLTSTTYFSCSLFVPFWGNVFCCLPSCFEPKNTRQVCVHVCVWL